MNYFGQTEFFEVSVGQTPKKRYCWFVNYKKNSVLGCLGCYNKIPQTGQLEQQTFIFHNSVG